MIEAKVKTKTIYNLIVAIINVNSDRRVENKDDFRYGHTARAFESYSFNNRMPMLEQLFDLQLEKNTSIFAVQELDENSVKLVENYFKFKGFEVVIDKYCPDKGAFYYLTAYNPKVIGLEKHRQTFFTESGLPTTVEERAQLTKEEKFKRHCNTEFEKSAQIFNFTVEENRPFVLVNVHAGMPNAHKIAVMQKLGEALKDEKDPCMIAGDFNMFDDTKTDACIYEDQIKELEKYGFVWASKNLAEQGLQSTFFTYIHDIERFMTSAQKTGLDSLKAKGTNEEIRQFYLSVIKKNESMMIGVSIDVVATRNFEDSVKVTSKMLFKQGQNFILLKPSKMSMNKNEFNKQYVGELQDGNPPSASDHSMMVAKAYVPIATRKI